MGRELKGLAAVSGIQVEAPSRDQLDLASQDHIARWIEAEPWDAVINAAAYTQVDAAESETAAAWDVNATAPGHIAKASARRLIPLIHISTDYVFDGEQGRPYVETDAVRPLNVYGESKEAGERAVRALNPRHIVLRTSWVYSPHGKNFVKTMLRLASERDRVKIVSDQRGRPTAAIDIARTCLDLACDIINAPQRAAYGTYHFAGAGEATWSDFASAIFKQASHRLPSMPDVIPIQTAEYPTPARRPLDTRLNCDAITRAWRITPRPWQDALSETLEHLFAGEQAPAPRAPLVERALTGSIS